MSVLRTWKESVTIEDVGNWLTRDQDHASYTAIELPGKGIQDDVVTLLLSLAMRCTNLRAICLRQNEITDRCAVDMGTLLAQAPALTHLDLSRNRIGCLGGEAVGKTFLTMSAQLKEAEELVFNLSNNSIEEKGIVGFAPCLSAHRALALQLRATGCTDRALKEILASKQVLSELDVALNPIGVKGLEDASNALKGGTGLHTLRIAQLEYADKHGKRLAKPLAECLGQMPALSTFACSGNHLGDHGSAEVVNALCKSEGKPLMLERLALGENGCGVHSAKALRRVLGQKGPTTRSDASRLRLLKLEGNKLDCECAKLIGEGLEQSVALQDLQLARNNIKDKGAAALANALRKQRQQGRMQGNNTPGCVISLDLAKNPIGDEGAKALARAASEAAEDPASRDFQSPWGLERLNVGETKIGNSGCNELASAVASRAALADSCIDSLGDKKVLFRLRAHRVRRPRGLEVLGMTLKDDDAADLRESAQARMQRSWPEVLQDQEAGSLIRRGSSTPDVAQRAPHQMASSSCTPSSESPSKVDRRDSSGVPLEAQEDLQNEFVVVEDYFGVPDESDSRVAVMQAADQLHLPLAARSSPVRSNPFLERANASSTSSVGRIPFSRSKAHRAEAQREEMERTNLAVEQKFREKATANEAEAALAAEGKQREPSEPEMEPSTESSIPLEPASAESKLPQTPPSEASQGKGGKGPPGKGPGKALPGKAPPGKAPPGKAPGKAPPGAAPPVEEAPAKGKGKGPGGKGKGKGPPPPGAAEAPSPERGQGKGKGKGGPPPPKKAGGGPPAPKGKAKSKASPDASPSVKSKGPDTQTPFTRKLHWVNPNYDDPEGETIFTELGDEDHELDFDPGLLERMFAGDGKGAGRTTRRFTVTSNKPSGIIVLDANRAQNIAIVLQKVAMPSSDICNTLKDLDFGSSRLGIDDVELLMTAMPTAEESKKLLEHKNAIDGLRDIEQKVMPFVLLPRVLPRLKIMKLALSHPATYKGLLQRCTVLSKAAEEVRKSKPLRNVLSVTLNVGNFINHGSKDRRAAGTARAFAIESLHTLESFKVGSVSVMHFLCFSICKADTSFLQKLTQSMSHIPGAAKEKSLTLKGAVEAFTSELTFAKRMLETEAAEASEAGKARMEALVHDIMEESDFLQQELQRALKLSTDVQKYFNASSKNGDALKLPPCEEFFEHFAQFLLSFERTWHEVEKNSDIRKKFMPGQGKAAQAGGKTSVRPLRERPKRVSLGGAPGEKHASDEEQPVRKDKSLRRFKTMSLAAPSELANDVNEEQKPEPEEGFFKAARSRAQTEPVQDGDLSASRESAESLDSFRSVAEATLPSLSSRPSICSCKTSEAGSDVGLMIDVDELTDNIFACIGTPDSADKSTPEFCTESPMIHTKSEVEFLQQANFLRVPTHKEEEANPGNFATPPDNRVRRARSSSRPSRTARLDSPGSRLRSQSGFRVESAAATPEDTPEQGSKPDAAGASAGELAANSPERSPRLHLRTSPERAGSTERAASTGRPEQAAGAEDSNSPRQNLQRSAFDWSRISTRPEPLPAVGLSPQSSGGSGDRGPDLQGRISPRQQLQAALQQAGSAELLEPAAQVRATSGSRDPGRPLQGRDFPRDQLPAELEQAGSSEPLQPAEGAEGRASSSDSGEAGQATQVKDSPPAGLVDPPSADGTEVRGTSCCSGNPGLEQAGSTASPESSAGAEAGANSSTNCGDCDASLGSQGREGRESPGQHSPAALEHTGPPEPSEREAGTEESLGAGSCNDEVKASGRPARRKALSQEGVRRSLTGMDVASHEAMQLPGPDAASEADAAEAPDAEIAPAEQMRIKLAARRNSDDFLEAFIMEAQSGAASCGHVVAPAPGELQVEPIRPDDSNLDEEF